MKQCLGSLEMLITLLDKSGSQERKGPQGPPTANSHATLWIRTLMPRKEKCFALSHTGLTSGMRTQVS